MRKTGTSVAALLVLLSLFVPSILCVVPAAAMTASEHDCCLHMSQQCGNPSLSACCAIVPNTALTTVVIAEKTSIPSGQDIQHAVVAFEEAVPLAAFAVHVNSQDATTSPPLIPSPSSITVLRI